MDWFDGFYWSPSEFWSGDGLLTNAFCNESGCRPCCGNSKETLDKDILGERYEEQQSQIKGIGSPGFQHRGDIQCGEKYTLPHPRINRDHIVHEAFTLESQD